MPIKCWEFKKCGRDKDESCPAYPAHGRMCWSIAGTMCGGKVQGTYAEKVGNCRNCDFYQGVLNKSH